jgi:hypothetical protein
MPIAADTAAAPQEIRLFVEVEQGVREWRIDAAHGRLVPVPDNERRAPPPTEWHRERSRQESAARAAIAATRGYEASRYDLAIPSPDCKHAAVLTGRVSVVDPYSRAFHGELPALAAHADVMIPKDRTFAAGAWTPDSRYVILLDERRHEAANGIPYASYSVSIVDTGTGKVTRANAAQEVRYGSALLVGTRGTCPAAR